jgi:hypothetical protein
MIYHTSQEDTLAAGSVVMCRYLSRLEVPETVSPMVGYNSLQTAGMLFCQFSPNHKISSIEMVFDVMSFMQQLQVNSKFRCVFLSRWYYDDHAFNLSLPI